MDDLHPLVRALRVTPWHGREAGREQPLTEQTELYGDSPGEDLPGSYEDLVNVFGE